MPAGRPRLIRSGWRTSDAWTGNPSGWAERLAMEAVLTLTGDVDALVAVLAANLDARGLGHLRIVTELEQADRAGEALSWAERGLREASEPDERLADFVVERYRAAGRISEALAIRKDRFTADPGVASYELLLE